MRKVNLYVIYDAVAETFSMSPFTAINDNEAKRFFCMTMKDANNAISENPHDFSILRVGKYDRITGEIKDTPHVKVLSGAEALVIISPNNDVNIIEEKEDE